MLYGLHILSILDLIHGDLLGHQVLIVLYSTVGEVIPGYLQLSENLLDDFQNLTNPLLAASQLEVIDMYCYHCDQFGVVDLSCCFDRSCFRIPRSQTTLGGSRGNM